MGGQRVGYIRVSSLDQSTARQLDGLALERTFVDKASGKDARRPQLEAMCGFVREGDSVVVHSMDRLARNLDDLRSIVARLTAKGVEVHFVKEQLVFTGDDTAIANLLLSVMGAFAEFERSLIRERQREGIELAKARGAYRGRRRSLSDDQVAEIRRRVDDGIPKAALARQFDVSRETLYQALRSAVASQTPALDGGWSDRRRVPSAGQAASGDSNRARREAENRRSPATPVR
ncbi:MAG: recombinase family protein [Candidatus Dormibacteraeota bacterium]|jgi:DNA invertase Pin-like site-specific DNA recombinase|nr:recombinase family protein [Candidatus Dormibacteraeota bacterium]